jgi:hypothetical protein
MKRVTASIAAAAASACSTVAPPPVAAPVPPPQAVAPAPPPAAVHPAPDPARYTCDEGRVLSLREAADGLTVEGLEPQADLLLRDAGGVGPQQSVWSNDRLRVELGLGEDGKDAVVHVLQPSPRDLRCRRS